MSDLLTYINIFACYTRSFCWQTFYCCIALTPSVYTICTICRSWSKLATGVLRFVLAFEMILWIIFLQFHPIQTMVDLYSLFLFKWWKTIRFHDPSNECVDGCKTVYDVKRDQMQYDLCPSMYNTYILEINNKH